VAVLLLVLSAGASLTFVLARGGVALPTPPPTRGPLAGASALPASQASPSASSAVPSRAAEPSATVTLPPGTAPSPAPTAAPSPTSDRYAVLVACPNMPNCWIYTIRQGDNLVSIANWFGVPLATIYEMNPGLRSTTLRAGMQIRIPTPTR
jgi:LysM repeat protein